MNKLDELIAACAKAMEPFPSLFAAASALNNLDLLGIRRILEAVRGDLLRTGLACQPETCGPGECKACPLEYHAATRAALEQLK